MRHLESKATQDGIQRKMGDRKNFKVSKKNLKKINSTYIHLKKYFKKIVLFEHAVSTFMSMLSEYTLVYVQSVLILYFFMHQFERAQVSVLIG